jgi:hypothetical protein
MPLTNAGNDIADPILYRLYWSLMLNDILHKQGFDATKENKEELHEFHKKELGYDTIAGRTQEIVSQFLFEVCCYWAVEKGIFVRTSKDQPYDIEQLPLSQVWNLL